MVSKVISAATLVLVTGENVDPPLRTDIHLKGAIKGGTYCDSYSDDVVFTKDGCAEYDIGACEDHCSSGTTCYDFCGNGTDSCGDGGGATCALTALSNLATTCGSLGFSVDDAMIQKLNVHFADGKVKGVQKLDDVQHDATAHGCDEHAYCDFCDAACETVMSTVALDMWGEQRWIRSYNRMGSGPMALEMLSDAHHMCETIETSYAYLWDETEDDDTMEIGSVNTLTTTNNEKWANVKDRKEKKAAKEDNSRAKMQLDVSEPIADPVPVGESEPTYSSNGGSDNTGTNKVDNASMSGGILVFSAVGIVALMGYGSWRRSARGSKSEPHFEATNRAFELEDDEDRKQEHHRSTEQGTNEDYGAI